jgi:hypothetical protein
VATAPQPNLGGNALTTMMTGRSSSVGCAKLVKEAMDAAAAVAGKKATDQATAKEAVPKKIADVTAEKKATDDVAS